MAKKSANDKLDLHGGRVRVPRSRGAISGFVLVLLGIWGALIPLVGPYAHFGYTPDATWHVSGGRVWLEILPGAAAALGGLLLLTAANRITASFGGWLAAVGGAWFVVGPTLRTLLHIGSVGTPIHTSDSGRALETLLLFSGIGAAILFIAGVALGRLAVVGIRDVLAAQRRENEETRVVEKRADADDAAVVDDRPRGVSRRRDEAGDGGDTEERADVDRETPAGATRLDLARERADRADE